MPFNTPSGKIQYPFLYEFFTGFDTMSAQDTGFGVFIGELTPERKSIGFGGTALVGNSFDWPYIGPPGQQHRRQCLPVRLHRFRIRAHNDLASYRIIT
jgi:hypothetical protein